MRIRNTDDNNDWTFGQSQINYVKEQASVLLDIKLRLNEWYRDCFFALQKGIPWSIRLGYKNQKNITDKDIKNTVLNTSGVLNISDFSNMINDRKYRATMKIYTQYDANGQNLTFETEL